MDRTYLCLPFEYLEEMEELTDEEYGRLVRALQRYSMTGEAISPVGNERFYAKRAMRTEDHFRACFEEKAEKRSASGRKAANARWNKNADVCERMRTHDDALNRNAENAPIVLDIDIDNSDIESNKLDNNVVPNSNVVPKEERKEKEKKERKRFVPPTVSEVQAYIREKGYNVDPEKFVAYYESKGWLVGKSPMKNWKAAVVTWSKNNYQRPSQTTSSNGFLDILRDMEAEEQRNGVIVSEQEGDGTGPFGFASGLP